MNREKAVQRFRGARVARLATVGADGLPHLVPVTFALAPDADPLVVVTVVDQKPKTTTKLRRLRNIAATGRVSLLADHYDDDWTQLWWVRLDGTARTVSAASERAEPIAWLTTKYPQYQANSPTGPVIRITVHTVTGWAASPLN